MASALRAQWNALVGRASPVWGAAILVATVNVFLFAFDRPWTASDGLRNWGDWVLTGVGVLRRPDLLPPWLYSGSLLNLGVLLGGAAGALCAREFAVRVPAPGELIKGAAGGAFMGVGATLAFGCNIGGFFSAVSALSLAGFAMMVGLGVGAFLGLRYLLWETAHRPGWSSGRGRTWARAGRDASRQPLVGVLLLVALVAAALALVVSTLGFAILKFTDLKDKGDWVFAAAGIGGLLGGTLFGIGMTLAGGCGAGSIWRAGEGQVKLWAAVACFALGASVARLVLGGALAKVGVAVFLPSAVGWGAAVLLVIVVAAAWALAATWNEDTRKFTVPD